MADRLGLEEDAGALVEQIAHENDSKLLPSYYLDLLSRAGSRIEHGTFTRLCLHAGLVVSTLDLRPFRALEEVSANSAGWSRRIERLRLGEHPRLKKLLVGGHGLSSIELAGCTALVDLDVAGNALDELALPRGAPLEILNASRNRLEAIDLSQHATIERLEVMDNRLQALELEHLQSLRGLWCARNSIRSLAIAAEAPLKSLAIVGNPMTKMPTEAHRGLETFFCDRVPLEALDLSRNEALVQLGCEDLSLTTLSLPSKAPRLTRLSTRGTPLDSLDVRPFDALVNLEVDPRTTIVCAERQKRAIATLRKKFELPSHEKIADMDPFELDLLASDHNWDDGVRKLLQIVTSPRCDRGTALAIYWLGQPRDFSRYREPKDAPKEERAVVQLLRLIEARIARDDFATREIPFAGEPSDDPNVPRAMCEPS